MENIAVLANNSVGALASHISIFILRFVWHERNEKKNVLVRAFDSFQLFCKFIRCLRAVEEHRYSSNSRNQICWFGAAVRLAESLWRPARVGRRNGSPSAGGDRSGQMSSERSPDSVRSWTGIKYPKMIFIRHLCSHRASHWTSWSHTSAYAFGLRIDFSWCICWYSKRIPNRPTKRFNLCSPNRS